jgi:hypothetical protein
MPRKDKSTPLANPPNWNRQLDDWTQENAATYQQTQPWPQLPYARAAAFVTCPRRQLVHPVPAQNSRRVPYTIHFKDGPRQLLWGDLHMHSKLSGCS